MGFCIHKVSPPADALADQKAVDPQVRKGEEADLPDTAEHDQGQGGGNDAAA